MVILLIALTLTLNLTLRTDQILGGPARYLHRICFLHDHTLFHLRYPTRVRVGVRARARARVRVRVRVTIRVRVTVSRVKISKSCPISFLS